MRATKCLVGALLFQQSSFYCTLALAASGDSSSNGYDYVNPLIGTINGGNMAQLQTRCSLLTTAQAMYSPALLCHLVGTQSPDCMVSAY